MPDKVGFLRGNYLVSFRCLSSGFTYSNSHFPIDITDRRHEQGQKMASDYLALKAKLSAPPSMLLAGSLSVSVPVRSDKWPCIPA